MKPKTPARIKQPTPIELRDQVLDFIRRKFYQTNPQQFYKDRSNLLRWVVLKPAGWLNEKGVTISTTEYRSILVDKILMEALRFGSTDSIKYLPAWLGKVVDEHLIHHGEEYYEAAKTIRATIEHTMLLTNQRPATAPDPIRELAQAASLLKPTRRPKAQPATQQTDLFPGL